MLGLCIKMAPLMGKPINIKPIRYPTYLTISRIQAPNLNSTRITKAMKVIYKQVLPAPIKDSPKEAL